LAGELVPLGVFASAEAGVSPTLESAGLAEGAVVVFTSGTCKLELGVLLLLGVSGLAAAVDPAAVLGVALLLLLLLLLLFEDERSRLDDREFWLELADGELAAGDGVMLFCTFGMRAHSYFFTESSFSFASLFQR
jgi:hypothetical protein